MRSKHHHGTRAKLPRTIANTLALLAIPLALGTFPGCNKPKEADCKKAIDNIRRLYGTVGNEYGVTPQAMVRSCRGSASPKSVQCFIQAKSIEELESCEDGAFSKLFGNGEKTTPGTETTPAPGTTPAPATTPAAPAPGTTPAPATPPAAPAPGTTPAPGATSAPATPPAAPGATPAGGAAPAAAPPAPAPGTEAAR